ncbi:MAG: 23S rRNA (guanosine(2251)-2'-O)-methyltransferase RlmB [Candidatus Schekmanbacteria bacterium]|nr:23S rRNA (guanosine(2251)-2'-O)-methyltransferase RlmB [Candidatus Schekmanbacteria bacterium]
MKEKIYGVHPVIEAVSAGKRHIYSIYLSKEKSPEINRLIKLAKERNIPLKNVATNEVSRLVPGIKHQGVVAVSSALPTWHLDDLISHAFRQSEKPFLIFADCIQDPHNLGALIRSAESVGCQGLVLSLHQTADLNPTVAKTSAGALEHLPIARVKNSAEGLQHLKNNGFWLAALHPEGSTFYDEVDLTIPVAIIVGGEGIGLRPALQHHCDWLVKLPQMGKINSLNTAVAAALMLYEVRRQRRHALTIPSPYPAVRF